MSENNSVYIESLQVPQGTRTPGDIQSLIDLVGQYLRIRGVENYSQILVGSIPPTQENEDAIWFEVDGTGEPVALKVWDGFTWRVLEFRVPFGSSDDRPEEPKEGEKFYDVTISQELIYISGMWRTSWGGKGQRIFVAAGSVEEAERLYPGWQADTAAQGLFIRGANNEMGAEATGGASKVTLTVDNLPPHHHENGPIADSEASRPYPFGVGEDEASIVDSKTPAQDTSAAAKTSSTGKGESFDITPPYYTLWVLKRTE